MGWQISEALKAHEPLDKEARRKRVIELLDEVGIPEPARRAAAFPHQLSGGMSQRVMIAMALACRPKLLIADEPTTALDVTIQAQILDLMLRLRKERGMGIVLITHDMGVVAEMADQVIVQYAARQVERNTAATLFRDPHHPYTAALWPPCRSAQSRGRRCRPFPASCPASAIFPRAACSRRAAPMRWRDACWSRR